MSAGKFDRRISLQRATSTDDGFTSAGSVSWNTLAEVWAQVMPVSDGERWRASQLSAVVTHRFKIRYSAAVSSLNGKDRLLFDGQEFDISGVKEIGRKKELEITASARAD